MDITETPERGFGTGASTVDGFRDLTLGGGNRDVVAIHPSTHTPGPAKYTPRDFERQQRDVISQTYRRSVSGKLQMEEHRLPPSEVGPWEAHKAYRSAEADKDDKVSWEKAKAPIKPSPSIQPQFNRFKFGEAKRPELFQNLAYARVTQNLGIARNGHLGWRGRPKTASADRLYVVPGDPDHAEYPGPGDVELSPAARNAIGTHKTHNVSLQLGLGVADPPKQSKAKPKSRCEIRPASIKAMRKTTHHAVADNMETILRYQQDVNKHVERFRKAKEAQEAEAKAAVEDEDQSEARVSREDANVASAVKQDELTPARPNTAPATSSGLELEREPLLSSTLSTTYAEWHMAASQRHMQEQVTSYCATNVKVYHLLESMISAALLLEVI